MWHTMVAESVGGCVGGMAKTLCVYPLDVATTRREVSSSSASAADAGGQFVAGLGFTLAMCPIYALLFHSAYAYAARYGGDFAGSTFGSLVASSVGVPMECVKHRLQLGVSLRRASRSGLYDGYVATLARNLPYNVFIFVSFAFFVRLGFRTWQASLAAGLFAAIFTHPLDLVNTRIQTARTLQHSRFTAPSAATNRLQTQPRPSLLGTLKSAASSHALFDGIVYKCLSFPPASFVFFSLYHPVRAAVLAVLDRRTPVVFL